VRSLGGLQNPLGGVVAWITAHSMLVGLIFGTVALLFVSWLIRGLRKREAREVLITQGAVIRFSQVDWGDNGKAIAHTYLRIRRMLDETMAEKGRFDTAREAIHSPTIKTDFPRLNELEELTMLYERARFATEDLPRTDLHRAHALAREVKKELEAS
jgi:hypothetical protein